MAPDKCAGSRDVAEVVAGAVVALLAYGLAGVGEGEEREKGDGEGLHDYKV